jgi:hypothetical protein
MRRPPDCNYLHQEMARSGVTLSLLWHEYVETCRQNKEIPYSYRQFCRFYNSYVIKTKATMRIKRQPGEAMEVDWAGQTASIQDSSPDRPFLLTFSYLCYLVVNMLTSRHFYPWIHQAG